MDNIVLIANDSQILNVKMLLHDSLENILSQTFDDYEGFLSIETDFKNTLVGRSIVKRIIKGGVNSWLKKYMPFSLNLLITIDKPTHKSIDVHRNVVEYSVYLDLALEGADHMSDNPRRVVSKQII